MRGRIKDFIAKIPARRITGTGKILGTIIYMLDVPHRRIVRRNLKFIHPDWPPEKIRELSRRVFQNLGITTAEILQMACLSREDILGKAVIKNAEHLHNAIKKQKGVIIISAHLGNWEMACLFARCYLQTPMAVVAKRLRPRIINRWIVGLRTRFGVTHLYKEGALSEMTRVLRQGHLLGILIDQGTKSSESVVVSYFGRTVAATPAAAMLAMRCKSPVLPIFCVREPNSRFTIIVEAPLQLNRTRNLREDLTTNTQIMTDAIEKAVRAYPEQWFWVHKRWKRHYPQIYPEYTARRERRQARKRKKAHAAKL